MPEGLCGQTELEVKLRDKKGRKQGRGIWEKHRNILRALRDEVKKIKGQGNLNMARDDNAKKAFNLYMGERRRLRKVWAHCLTRLSTLLDRIEKRLIYQMSDHLPDISGPRGHGKGWTNDKGEKGEVWECLKRIGNAQVRGP